MTERVFYYVRHSDRAAFEALGWVYSADLGMPHAAYSSLYEWAGEGEPRFPNNDLFAAQEREKQVRAFDEVFGPPEELEQK
jgi:hypothetical protein